MPFSNQQGKGFENKVVELLAARMSSSVEYAWFAERKSFVKHSLDQGMCDVVMGVPSSLPDALTTHAYYRSTYVFVTRHDRALRITSLTDPRLSQLRIGIHVVGDDYAPPAYVLARRGITQNILGYSLFGEYGEVNPPRKLIDAVENGDVDVAVVWGPFAGYFAQSEKSELDIEPVTPSTFLGVPFAYDISLAVRKGNERLKTALNAALENESGAIQRVLQQYGVPQVH